MKIGTLFSGGLASCEFALKYLNIDHEVIFACEWDKYARQQYLQFHKAPNTFYKDVSDMDGTPYKDKIDLMVWGFPCTDISLAGKMKGITGDSSKLFWEGLRIQKEVMPKWAIIENVANLISIDDGKTIKVVLMALSNIGYEVTMDILNTKDFSVPQNRLRLFIVCKRIN